MPVLCADFDIVRENKRLNIRGPPNSSRVPPKIAFWLMLRHNKLKFTDVV